MVLLKDVRLRETGFDAPENLDRGLSQMEAWRSPDLLLGQTCGLPYVTRLQDRCSIIGAPIFAPAEGEPTLPPGTYQSVVVVRADDPRTSLAEFQRSTAVMNGMDSLSGSMALLELVADEIGQNRFFGTIIASGSHAASMAYIADSRADIAAIDCTTWRLAQCHLPAASALRVLTRTLPAPALPYITARGRDVTRLAEAIELALSRVGEEAKSKLGLSGFCRMTEADYSGLKTRHRATSIIAEAHGLTLAPTV